MARRSKKKTYSQQIAGVATIGMPAPVQKVATSRLGSKIILIVVPILIATGVISISFNGYLPSINFNQERAAAVGRDIGNEAYKAAERVRQYDSSYR